MTNAATATRAQASPDFNAIKAKQKAAWMDGDYARFATYMEPGARQILTGWNIAPGQRLLDVACGAGQNAIPAAHAGIEATGVDIAGNLIAHAQERAKREGVDVRFDEGDAEQLPYADAPLDTGIRVVGAQLAPPRDKGPRALP